ncbi:hypothetical protein [Agriterribacter sp.]|uniref:hypothetical protein n=1 Tax=Agriterribacter sp. TaxID=2821509 RepID=UPI002C5979BD|nr:hypothetical protein [Agriterribacter sp.]HTN08851.1 hypothetical protein [Agriterribacter sp.]
MNNQVNGVDKIEQQCPKVTKNTSETSIPGGKNSLSIQQIVDEINRDETSINPAITLADFEHLRVTKEKAIPHPEPTIKIDGAAIAAPGNITGISAQMKAGKTAIKGVIIASAISETGTADGFPTITSEPANGKAIIDLDTEQSEADQQDNLNSILRRVGLEATPKNLLSYNTRQLSMKDYRTFTDNICMLCAKEFGGIHLITIDGGADYISSVNDEEQANEILEYFTHLSIKYNCPVIIIVHLNPNSDKERGHFGSQLQRKCYGLITIEKDKGSDISTLIPKAFRKAGNGDVQPIHFTYNKEKHHHVQIDAPDRDSEKAVAVVAKHKSTAKEVFQGQKSMSYTEAVHVIMKHTNRKERTAKEMIANMKGWKFIVTAQDGNLRLNHVEYE